MYHPEIVALDNRATELYAQGKRKEATQCQLEAGRLQQRLVRPTGKRYVNEQWVWAYGHIGLLGMALRWFQKTGESIVLQTQGKINNQYFLKALAPYLTITEQLPSELKREAEDNAVYFACPDGELSIHNFYKMVERECPRLPLQEPNVDDLLATLEIRRPYVALHARQFNHDPARNITMAMVEAAIEDEHLDIVSIGLDEHPINDILPNVLKMPNPALASFQLSAACDKFIGSNSGAWTVANAYGKPVTLMNDLERKAWIYPESIDE